MKKRYLILIILCLILFFASLVEISAAEDLVSSDTLSVSQSDDEIMASGDNATFTFLQKKINEAPEGSIINLENNYAYDSGFSIDGIIINKELTINGNGYTIDALGQSRIFNITSDNVILTDITFKNANALDNGGAINCCGDNVTLNNCNFKNNTAMFRGGAVYWYADNGIITNSNFTNNTAIKYSGGAIQWDGNSTNATVHNCNFINNTGTQKGGAIFWYANNGIITNSHFINSTSINGGAIYWENNALNGEITNSSFINNTGDDGGAIYWYGANGIVTACNFTNNRGADGGAINWQRTNGLIDKCNFKNNTAEYDGGAVYWEGTNGTLTSSSFTGNTAEYDGGAVHWYGANGRVTACNFTNNTAESNGGAVCFMNQVSDSAILADYINNSASEGSAIYFNSEAENLSISGKFIDNNANSTIYINQPISGTIIHDSIFIDNTGSDISANSGEVHVEDSWFGNNATNYTDKPMTANVEMTNWLFLNATAEPDRVILNKNSSVTFKLYSYNETSKEINEYDSSKMDVTLELSQTLGELNQTETMLGDEIAYTAKEIGNALITGKFESAYYTLTIESFTSVNGSDILKVFRNNTQYSATFRDSEGKYLKDGSTVKFKINGVTYERKVSGDKGLASLNINLDAGKYIITNCNPITGEESTNNITVISKLTENKDLRKYYRNATQYTLKVIGDDGKAAGAGETVTFNVNGVLYNRTTNESGIAKLNINLQPGNYIITAEYANCRVSNNITVLPVLSANNLTKNYGTPDQFIATLLDGEGIPYAEQSVTFNVNGVIYNRITDSSGQAKLNINLMPGEYIITSSYNETNVSNKITVKS